MHEYNLQFVCCKNIKVYGFLLDAEKIWLRSKSNKVNFYCQVSDLCILKRIPGMITQLYENELIK